MAASFSGGEKLKEKLAEVVKKLNSASVVRVGFAENGQEYADGVSVATAAIANNFGAPAAGIPPRPFFTNAVTANRERWGQLLGEQLIACDHDARKALGLVGRELAGDIIGSIDTTNEPPDAPATIRRKGSDKPLIDTGRMRQALDDPGAVAVT